MTTWNLSPQYKKSAVERMYWYKDGKTIVIEQGFRWANFKVESNEQPLTQYELVNEDGYELGCIDNDEYWEMWDMTDGCWLDIEKGRDCTDEDLEAFEEAWEEDSYEGVEALGWSNDETEYWYYGPLALTNEDTGQEFTGENLDNVSVSGVPLTLEVVEDTLDWTPLEEEKSLLTEWYPVNINPVREGTYQVMHEELETKWPFGSNVTSAVWNGKKWDDKKVVKWRGLTEEVK